MGFQSRAIVVSASGTCPEAISAQPRLTATSTAKGLLEARLADLWTASTNCGSAAAEPAGCRCHHNSTSALMWRWGRSAPIWVSCCNWAFAAWVFPSAAKYSAVSRRQNGLLRFPSRCWAAAIIAGGAWTRMVDVETASERVAAGLVSGSVSSAGFVAGSAEVVGGGSSPPNCPGVPAAAVAGSREGAEGSAKNHQAVPAVPPARTSSTPTQVAVLAAAGFSVSVGSSGSGFSPLATGAVKIGTRHSGLAHLTSRPAAWRGRKPGASHIGQWTRQGRFLVGWAAAGIAR